MKQSLKTILIEANKNITLPHGFEKNLMIEIRLIHSRKQFYKFIINLSKVVIALTLLSLFLGIHLSGLMASQNSMLMSMIVDTPTILLSSAGMKAFLEIFPSISFILLIISIGLSYKFIKQFNSQQIIPLNSPIYEIFYT